MDEKLRAALDLLRSAMAVESTRQFAIGPLVPYAESVDQAVGNTLEFASALLSDLANEDEPFEEIGEEPISRSDAIRLVPKFIDRCCEILAGQPPFPCMCMSVRAQTFALILAYPD